MSKYNYKARDARGKPVKGAMEAVSKNELIDKLNKMGYMPTYVSEASGISSLELTLQKTKRISHANMLLFYIQFANMINAGITILMCLRTLQDQIENVKLKETITGVANSVEGGDPLSKSFALYPVVFPRLFINMIKAGEASGKLDTVLVRYAKFFEYQQELNEKVRSALFYPAILLCAGITVTLFIVTAIIPQFASIYMDAGINLPGITLVVYKIGMAIKNYWHIFILSGVSLIIGFKYYTKTSKGSLLLDRLKLKLPIIGPLLRKVAIARSSRTLATLVGSGVPILISLEITRDVIDNKVLAFALDSVRASVEKGERIAEPLKVSGEFPPDLIQMVNVGEESGKLDEMLNKVADFYDMVVEYAVKKLTTIIEPIFLVIMGIMIGTIMASMLLPIFDMMKTLQR